MKMRNLLTIICGVTMAFSLAACSGSKPEATTAVQESTITEETSTTEAVQRREGEFNVGKFSLILPDGWKAFPQIEVFAEKDANGNYPIDKSLILVSKAAEDEVSLFANPYVSIRYYEPDEELDLRTNCYDVKEIDVPIYGYECEAFAATSTITQNYRYEYIHLTAGNGQFVVYYPIEIDNEPTGLTYADPDIVMMLGSLLISGARP